MAENKETRDLAITDDLKPILSVLKQEDAQAIVALKEELTDTWTKKQIFRTETEMRISVLNDGKHPTQASKYWQSVREQNAMFEALMGLSFDLRKSNVKRLKLERKLQAAIDSGDDLKQMSIQIDLDENLYGKANMEQTAHDRVRELNTWSQIKGELKDGSFDDENVNSHQAESYKLALTNRVKSLGPNAGPAEVVNAVGPLQTIERLKTQDGKLLDFKEAKLQLNQGKPEQPQQ
jgi:hypothetical protein|tara:strand:- start:376 stop:1080 length:705 start_codon:yes stop_codon:yes gene_type:complete